MVRNKQNQLSKTQSKEKLNSQQIMLALQKMRGMPTVREEKHISIFVLFEETVRYLELESKKLDYVILVSKR